MHLTMLMSSIITAWAIRNYIYPLEGSWIKRWQQTLWQFLFPCALLLMTAIAIIYMGHQGYMFGFSVSWYTYLIACSFVGMAGFKLLLLIYQGWHTLQKINGYPQIHLDGKLVRLLESHLPYCAQIGFWQPQLVVSRGLLETLDSLHLKAVLAHEEAHYHYRDTFWFFLLGWLRSCTAWLPHTETLWQELLLLREIRADLTAIKEVEGIVLAESLLSVTEFMMMNPINIPTVCAALNDNSFDRVVQRIEILLEDSQEVLDFSRWEILRGILSACLPLITLPLHS